MHLLFVVHAVNIVSSAEHNVNTLFGKSVSFSVEAEGVGNLSYQWRKDGENISPTTHPYCKGAHTPTLQIVCAVPEFEGGYTCVVSNALGSSQASQTTQLQVKRIRMYHAIYMHVCLISVRNYV